MTRQQQTNILHDLFGIIPWTACFADMLVFNMDTCVFVEMHMGNMILFLTANAILSVQEMTVIPAEDFGGMKFLRQVYL